MNDLLHHLVIGSACATPQAQALVYQKQSLTYEALAEAIARISAAFVALDLQRAERVALYMDKRFETVIAAFAAAAAGGAFVPINPLLKLEQVAYILQDCNVRILVTSAERLALLEPVLQECQDLHTVLVVGRRADTGRERHVLGWDEALAASSTARGHRVIDA